MHPNHAAKAAPAAPKARYALLDQARGLFLLNMALYHALWDVASLFGAGWLMRGPAVYWWQQLGSWGFILLSGFCLPLGSRPVRRGALVFGCGALVSAATILFTPDSAVRFGVLTMLGSAMMLTGLARPLLAKLPAGAGLAASAALFVLTRGVNQGYWGFEGLRLAAVPRWLYRLGWLGAYLGFPPVGFWSTDYFSLIPWLFLYLCGYFACRLLCARPVMQRLRCSLCPPLGWLGRHSLLFYLLHQPAIYGLCLAVRLFV